MDVQQQLELVLGCLTVTDFTSKSGLRDAIDDARYYIEELLEETQRTERLRMLAEARAAMRRAS